MTSRAPRIVVFYGGPAASGPRDELMAWLRGRSVGIDARRVSEWPAHSKGSVDDRVDTAIAWADGAIAILTPDDRSPNGAPNVIDEIGRWRGGRGKETICILSRSDVPPYSNHAGIVRPEFTNRIKEVFEDVREFISSLPPLKEDAEPTTKSSVSTCFEVASSEERIFIENSFFSYSKLEQASGVITVNIFSFSNEEETLLNRIGHSGNAFPVAFGNTALLTSLIDRVTQRGGGATSIMLKLRESGRALGRPTVEPGWSGSPSLNANEIATLRASRILLNEPPPVNERHMYTNVGAELLIRGGMDGALQVSKSPLIDALSSLARGNRSDWVDLRILMIFYLHITDCVEHVDVLRLTVTNERLTRIEFRGTRHQAYANAPLFVIKIDQSTDL